MESLFNHWCLFATNKLLIAISYFLFVMFFLCIVFLCAQKEELNKNKFDICPFLFINLLIVTFRLIERLVRFGLRLSVDYKHRVLKIDNNFLELLGLKTVLFR